MRSAAKLLRFPLGGLAKDGSYRDTTYPTEESVYSTPMAKNVIGECAFSGRLRGGSRPGLKPVEDVGSSEKARWLWPNGEPILWHQGGRRWTLLGDGDTSQMSVEVLEERDDGLYLRLMFNADEDVCTRWWWFDQTEFAEFPAEEWYGHYEDAFDVRAYMVDGERSYMAFNERESDTMPDGSKIILSHPPSATYRDRAFKAEGAVWMASKTGDFGNFDFGGDGEDPTRACAGNLSFAGKKGEDVTAFAPIGDARIFIATRRSLAVITGEPTSAMAIVSENVGIVSSDAWCNADGALYFVGPNGLYAVADVAPMLVSRQLPEDLKGLAYALLVYDPHYRGIHIFTDVADWFFDIERKAFWPVEYPASKMPDAGGLVMINGINRVIFHCVDGVWRYWDDAQPTDDGMDISSVVAIGPFKCGANDDVDGMLSSVTATMAKGSAQVSIDVFTAKSAEEAVERATEENPSPHATFSVVPGWNPVVRPRVRGAWCVLVVRSAGQWAYESIQANTKVLGRLRP